MSDLIERDIAIGAVQGIDLFAILPDDDGVIRTSAVEHVLSNLPSAQPDGWLEQNKDKILQAGMEGREIEFRIGGRLFAIREKAQ